MLREQSQRDKEQAALAAGGTAGTAGGSGGVAVDMTATKNNVFSTSGVHPSSNAAASASAAKAISVTSGTSTYSNNDSTNIAGNSRETNTVVDPSSLQYSSEGKNGNKMNLGERVRDSARSDSEELGMD